MMSMHALSFVRNRADSGIDQSDGSARPNKRNANAARISDYANMKQVKRLPGANISPIGSRITDDQPVCMGI
jgi:hypothetical protein